MSRRTSTVSRNKSEIATAKSVLLSCPKKNVANRLHPHGFGLKQKGRRPTRIEQDTPEIIARSIPEGRIPVNAQTKPLWRRARIKSARSSGRRGDWIKNHLALIEVLLTALDEDLGTTRPGWCTIAEETGMGISAINNHLRQLEREGAIAVVATGSGWGNDNPNTVNHRAVYVLCIETENPPPTKNTSPPAPPENSNTTKLSTPENNTNTVNVQTVKCSLNGYKSLAKDLAINPIPRASEKTPPKPKPTQPHTGEYGQFIEYCLSNLRNAPAGSRRTLKFRSLLTAVELKMKVPALRKASPWAIATEVRFLTTAGYTVNDLTHALDTRPGGSPWTYTSEITNPIGWLRYRLSAWLDPTTGQPHPSKSQRIASRKAKDAATRNQQQAETAALKAHIAAERAALPPGMSMRQMAKLNIEYRITAHEPGKNLTPTLQTQLEPLTGRAYII